jgi:hypothetical protein
VSAFREQANASHDSYQVTASAVTQMLQIGSRLQPLDIVTKKIGFSAPRSTPSADPENSDPAARPDPAIAAP